jgi:iron complex transport system substrate-binding protein
MKRTSGWWIILIGLLVLFGSFTWAAFYLPGSSSGLPFPMDAPVSHELRIISLAPSITETLFALHADKQVVGVTRFCQYPPEAKSKPKIGGYYDVDDEAIARLYPTMVVLLPEHVEQRKRFLALGIPTLVVEQHSLAGLISSYVWLGQLTQRPAEGAWLANTLRQTLDQYAQEWLNQPWYTTLLIIGSSENLASVHDLYIIGQGEIYNECLAFFHLRNVYTQFLPKYPQISLEGLLKMNPDIIIEWLPGVAADPKQIALRQKTWSQQTALRAVQNHGVSIQQGDYLTIPGPRLLGALAAIQQARLLIERDKPHVSP